MFIQNYSLDFPEQPVHHHLWESLYQETQRLRGQRGGATAPLSENFDLHVLALTLRGLEGPEGKRCLAPRRRAERDALIAEGLRLLRFHWKRQAKWDLWDYYQSKQRGRVNPLSLDAPLPETDGLTLGDILPDPKTAGGAPDHGTELEDEAERALLRIFTQERGIAYERAVVLARDLVSGKTLPEICEDLPGNIRQELPPYETLRKWVLRERKRVKPRLREECIRWGIAPRSPETSHEVSGDCFWERLLRCVGVAHRTRCPGSLHSLALMRMENNREDAAVQNAPRYEKTPHFREQQARRHISDQQVALALRFGLRRYDRGSLVYFLGRRHMPGGLDQASARKAEGTVVVVSHEDALITTYRNPKYLRKLRKRGT